MSSRLRLLLLSLLILGLLLGGSYLKQRGWLSLPLLRQQVLQAGALGVVLYCGAFMAGTLLHLPGLLFIAAAILCYGKVAGALLAWGAALLSLSLTFAIVRGVGGRLLTEVNSPLMRRLLSQLDRRPIRTVALLRVIFALSPPLNTGLALTGVRFVDYIVGSAVGLVVPMVLAALLIEWLIARL